MRLVWLALFIAAASVSADDLHSANLFGQSDLSTNLAIAQYHGIDISGSASHTILVTLQLPDAQVGWPRQWILNLGQLRAGSHHWLYRSDGIQFGAWDGVQLQQKLPVGQGELAVLCTTYDAATRTYSLFVNGELNQRVESLSFNILAGNLNVGHVVNPSQVEADFAGKIYQLAVWTHALDAGSVKTISAQALSKYAEFTLRSSGVVNGELGQKYTWDNASSISPPVEWFGAPPGTEYFTLFMVDNGSTPGFPYCFGCTDWNVTYIPGYLKAIPEGSLPPGCKDGETDGGLGYYGPSADGSKHTYTMTLTAFPSEKTAVLNFSYTAKATNPQYKMRWKSETLR